jgi:uncharacterized membrane protein YqjE
MATMPAGAGRNGAASMRKSAEPVHLASRPEIATLLHQLAGDGMRWADAELALARAELGDLRRRCIAAAIFAGAAITALLCALIILAQAAAAAIAPYLGSDTLAGLAIGVSLLVLAAICAMAMNRMFKWRAESLLFRWIAPAADRKGTSL